MTTPADQPFSLSNLMPAPAAPAPAAAPNAADVLLREIQMMQASGWTLYQRWPGGADFQSVSKSSISIGVHIILVFLTFGIWLLVMIPMELFGSGGQHKWCRLTIDELGQPKYETIGRPQPVA